MAARTRWMTFRTYPILFGLRGMGRERLGAAAGVTGVVVLGSGLAYGTMMVTASGLAPPVIPSSAPLGMPVLAAIPSTFEGLPLQAYLDASDVPEHVHDELLVSPVLQDPEFARAVHWWVEYWRVAAVDWFPGYLSRMAWLGTSVDSALVTHDFPPSLRYLPLIESGYNPSVTSRASAVGLWQLMAPTARELGLEVSSLIDERRDPAKSTEAALRYLHALHSEFGSWFVTLAAYNSGPTRVRRILRRHAPGQPLTDSLFWAHRHRFAPETREFVPKLYGAMWVASQPEAYGYEHPSIESFAFDAVRVPDQTTLDVIAWAADVSHEEIVRLNPALVRGTTPVGREMEVRVPVGQGEAFAFNYSRIPAEERVTFLEHVVRSGETLSQIAMRYGVRLGDITAVNPTVQTHNLQVGARLTVPVAPSVRRDAGL